MIVAALRDGPKKSYRRNDDIELVPDQVSADVSVIKVHSIAVCVQCSRTGVRSPHATMMVGQLGSSGGKQARGQESLKQLTNGKEYGGAPQRQLRLSEIECVESQESSVQEAAGLECI